MSNSSERPTDPRIYLAAERTFLAWIRTGIALMGFGFVVARFGLFLREIAATQAATQIAIKLPQSGFSLPAGITLIVIGVLVITVAALRHYRCVQALDRGEFRHGFGALFALSVAAVLAVIGVIVALYLATL